MRKTARRALKSLPGYGTLKGKNRGGQALRAGQGFAGRMPARRAFAGTWGKGCPRAAGGIFKEGY